MLFPKWSNKVLPVLLAFITIKVILIVVLVWYYFSPKNIEVGYAPKQPINYSHKLHAGELGIDCRYCHFTVEKSAHAAIPPTEVCMNCHNLVKKDGSEEIKKVISSYEQEKPIEWVKVHMLPDYTYFDHSRHVSAGVSCATCHGRVDKMEVVFQNEPLSMSWCLDCHRNPAANIRPTEFVTDLDWQPEGNPIDLGKKIMKEKRLYPREDCNTCHR